jgi:hypothetical protein
MESPETRRSRVSHALVDPRRILRNAFASRCPRNTDLLSINPNFYKGKTLSDRTEFIDYQCNPTHFSASETASSRPAFPTKNNSSISTIPRHGGRCMFFGSRAVSVEPISLSARPSSSAATISDVTSPKCRSGPGPWLRFHPVSRGSVAVLSLLGAPHLRRLLVLANYDSVFLTLEVCTRTRAMPGPTCTSTAS